MTLSWAEPVGRLLGDRTAAALRDSFSIETVGDLLVHLPRRYAERGTLTDLRWLRPDDYATVLARISDVRTRPMKNRRGTMLVATVTDGAATLSLTFFNQKWRERDLVVGRTGLFSGKVTEFRGVRQLSHPDYLMIDADEPDEALSAVDSFAGAILPIYPATAALPSWRVGKCVGVVLDAVAASGLDDPVPAELLAHHDLVPLAEAIRLVHRPQQADDAGHGRRRLAYDEALTLQLVLAGRRADAAAWPALPRVGRPDGLAARLAERLPWALTDGQRQVGAQIAADLARTHPMQRLLQGEVGSGKTIVALLAMLTVVDAGGQAVLLAPTEVLAQQHAAAIRELLGELGEAGRLGGTDDATSVVLLTGSMTAAQRRPLLAEVASGVAGIVVGTHALLTDAVEFADLGLVVVDEQHRFGVEQRDSLRAKADVPPHLLVMTATPIPRTVAMTVFGDLDVSTLRDLPAGRPEVTTHVVDELARPAHLARAWQKIAEEAAAGRRSFIVCPRIGSDDPDVAPADGTVELEADLPAEGPPRRPGRSVIELAEQLAAGPLAGVRLGVLHGRMPTEEKQSAMARFASGECDVLVTTTVIEVGVDVPEASVMVVMDADRFGVSQLHQLRGRIGRGSDAGLCLLVSATDAEPARRRLDAVAATRDGFELARVDLAARREGDVLGSLQSGTRSSLRVLSVLRDEDLIEIARHDADRLISEDRALARSVGLRDAVQRLIAGASVDYLAKT